MNVVKDAFMPGTSETTKSPQHTEQQLKGQNLKYPPLDTPLVCYLIFSSSMKWELYCKDGDDTFFTNSQLH